MENLHITIDTDDDAEDLDIGDVDIAPELIPHLAPTITASSMHDIENAVPTTIHRSMVAVSSLLSDETLDDPNPSIEEEITADLKTEIKTTVFVQTDAKEQSDVGPLSTNEDNTDTNQDQQECPSNESEDAKEQNQQGDPVQNMPEPEVT